MSEGLPVSSVTGNLCLTLSYKELVLPALREQWGFTGANAGATQGAHDSGASDQAVMVIQEQDGELSCHPAPWASLWGGTRWMPNEEDEFCSRCCERTAEVWRRNTSMLVAVSHPSK